MHLCSKPREARGIKPETFRIRCHLTSCPPTTGPNDSYDADLQSGVGINTSQGQHDVARLHSSSCAPRGPS